MIYANIKKHLRSSILSINILRYFYGLVTRQILIKRKLTAIDKIKPIEFIEGGEICDLFSPKIGGNEQHKRNISPDIKVYAFANVVGSINSNCFYDEKCAYIEKICSTHRYDANYASGNFIFHKNGNAIFTCNNAKAIEKTCLFLGGSGSFNYYHWLIEILPKILYLNKKIIDDLKIEAIVVNSKVAEIDSFMESLNAVISKINLRIIFCPQEQDLVFKKVVYISHINSILYNTNSNTTKLTDAIFCRSSLEKLRACVFMSQGFLNQKFNKRNFPKKLFLMRGKVNSFNKRDYNEYEVLSLFRENGFEPIYPEEYSFFEQAYLFKNADQIVGPSGAFWSNLIFCSPGTISLSWLPSKHIEFPVYSTIAKFFMVQMNFATYQADEGLHGSYNIEISKLKEISNDFLNL